MRILLLVLLSTAILGLAVACTDGPSSPVYSGPASDGQRIP